MQDPTIDDVWPIDAVAMLWQAIEVQQTARGGHGERARLTSTLEKLEARMSLERSRCDAKCKHLEERLQDLSRRPPADCPARPVPALPGGGALMSPRALTTSGGAALGGAPAHWAEMEQHVNGCIAAAVASLLAGFEDRQAEALGRVRHVSEAQHAGEAALREEAAVLSRRMEEMRQEVVMQVQSLLEPERVGLAEARQELVQLRLAGKAEQRARIESAATTGRIVTDLATDVAATERTLTGSLEGEVSARRAALAALNLRVARLTGALEGLTPQPSPSMPAPRGQVEEEKECLLLTTLQGQQRAVAAEVEGLRAEMEVAACEAEVGRAQQHEARGLGDRLAALEATAEGWGMLQERLRLSDSATSLFMTTHTEQVERLESRLTEVAQSGAEDGLAHREELRRVAKEVAGERAALNMRLESVAASVEGLMKEADLAEQEESARQSRVEGSQEAVAALQKEILVLGRQVRTCVDDGADVHRLVEELLATSSVVPGRLHQLEDRLEQCASDASQLRVEFAELSAARRVKSEVGIPREKALPEADSSTQMALQRAEQCEVKIEAVRVQVSGVEAQLARCLQRQTTAPAAGEHSGGNALRWQHDLEGVVAQFEEKTKDLRARVKDLERRDLGEEASMAVEDPNVGVREDQDAAATAATAAGVVQQLATEMKAVVLRVEACEQGAPELQAQLEDLQLAVKVEQQQRGVQVQELLSADAEIAHMADQLGLEADKARQLADKASSKTTTLDESVQRWSAEVRELRQELRHLRGSGGAGGNGARSEQLAWETRLDSAKGERQGAVKNSLIESHTDRLMASLSNISNFDSKPSPSPLSEGVNSISGNSVSAQRFSDMQHKLRTSLGLSANANR
eukprot:gene3147-3989_t